MAEMDTEDTQTLIMFNSVPFAIVGLAGLSFMEAGFVQKKNGLSSLIKNLYQMVIGALIWWLLGYGFAFGDSDSNGFIGKQNFAGDDFDDSEHPTQCLLSCMYGLTVVFIVNLFLMERADFFLYVALSAAIMGWIYPVAVSWSIGGGWLDDHFDVSYRDHFGASSIHMTAGTLGLLYILIARARLHKDKSHERQEHSITIAVKGTAKTISTADEDDA
jgi:Amt family ammonium transporter